MHLLSAAMELRERERIVELHSGTTASVTGARTRGEGSSTAAVRAHLAATVAVDPYSVGDVVTYGDVEWTVTELAPDEDPSLVVCERRVVP